MPKFVHPVIKTVANIAYTMDPFVDSVEKHARYEALLGAVNALTANQIPTLSKLVKAYNQLPFQENVVKSEIPDFLTFAIQMDKGFLTSFSNSNYTLVPTVTFKEAYRSLKTTHYEKITMLELGTALSIFKTNPIEWCTFLVIKNSFMETVEAPENDYSVYNLNSKKADISYFRRAVKPASEIYGPLTIPLVLYFYRYYKAVTLKSSSPIEFNLPKGLGFLPTIEAKHVHKNEKMTKFLQPLMQIMHNLDILQ